MQRSYPNLRSVFAPTHALIDVKAVTLAAFPDKVKLSKVNPKALNPKPQALIPVPCTLDPRP